MVEYCCWLWDGNTWFRGSSSCSTLVSRVKSKRLSSLRAQKSSFLSLVRVHKESPRGEKRRSNTWVLTGRSILRSSLFWWARRQVIVPSALAVAKTLGWKGCQVIPVTSWVSFQLFISREQLRMSNSFVLWSLLQVRSQSPLSPHSILLMLLLCLLIDRISSPTLGSQTRTEWSLLPLATRHCVGWQRTHCKSFPWPESTRSSCNFTRSSRYRSLSSQAETTLWLLRVRSLRGCSWLDGGMRPVSWRSRLQTLIRPRLSPRMVVVSSGLVAMARKASSERIWRWLSFWKVWPLMKTSSPEESPARRQEPSESHFMQLKEVFSLYRY